MMIMTTIKIKRSYIKSDRKGLRGVEGGEIVLIILYYMRKESVVNKREN